MQVIAIEVPEGQLGRGTQTRPGRVALATDLREALESGPVAQAEGLGSAVMLLRPNDFDEAESPASSSHRSARSPSRAPPSFPLAWWAQADSTRRVRLEMAKAPSLLEPESEGFRFSRLQQHRSADLQILDGVALRRKSKAGRSERHLDERCGGEHHPHPRRHGRRAREALGVDVAAPLAGGVSHRKSEKRMIQTLALRAEHLVGRPVPEGLLLPGVGGQGERPRASGIQTREIQRGAVHVRGADRPPDPGDAAAAFASQGGECAAFRPCGAEVLVQVALHDGVGADLEEERNYRRRQGSRAPCRNARDGARSPQ